MTLLTENVTWIISSSGRIFRFQASQETNFRDISITKLAVIQQGGETFNMTLAAFHELSVLAPLAREGVELEEVALKSALQGAFEEAVTLRPGSSMVNIGTREGVLLTDFVEDVLKGDVSMMNSLKAEMSPAAFRNISSAVEVAKGMSTLSEESYHMLSGIRSSLDDVAESLRALKAEGKMTQEAFEEVLKNSAKESAKTRELFNTYEKVASDISAAARNGKGLEIVGKIFSATILPGTFGIGIWQFLKAYARKNSGCYIFFKKTSKRYRVMELSRGMGTQTALCQKCELIDDLQDSVEKFKKSGADCNDLCNLKNLKAPYNDPKSYVVSCLELDEADALSDISGNIAGGIGPAITDFVYNFSKKMAPFAAVAGLGYLGFVYITTRHPAGPMAMMPSTPYYTRLNNEPEIKKLTSGYPGPLKKRHLQKK